MAAAEAQFSRFSRAVLASYEHPFEPASPLIPRRLDGCRLSPLAREDKTHTESGGTAGGQVLGEDSVKRRFLAPLAAVIPALLATPSQASVPNNADGSAPTAERGSRDGAVSAARTSSHFILSNAGQVYDDQLAHASHSSHSSHASHASHASSSHSAHPAKPRPAPPPPAYPNTRSYPSHASHASHSSHASHASHASGS
jgi:hypothetical protein